MSEKPVLLAGGNPRIAKGDGDAPVHAYLEAMPGWKKRVGQQIDALVTATLPDVHKAVKSNSPYYGVPGQGFFLSLHCFPKYVKVAFLRGAYLQPHPPGVSTNPEARHLDIHKDDVLDEARFCEWVRQASAMPGKG